MIMSDDKKVISTIMKMRKSAKGESLGQAPMKSEVVKHENGDVDGRHVAAQDMMAALHEKSPEKLMRAMANFQDLHSVNKGSASEE